MGRFVPDCLRRFAVGDLRAARLADPPAARTCATCRSRSACAPAAISTCPTGSRSTCRSSNIKTVNTGGFGARLKALLDEAKSRPRACCRRRSTWRSQLGLRTVIEDEFHTLWWVPETAAKEDVRAYLRGTRPRREGAATPTSRSICTSGRNRHPRGVRATCTLGLRQIHARRALRLPADAARGVRRGAGAGRALGPRRLPEGTLLREADLPRLGTEVPAAVDVDGGARDVAARVRAEHRHHAGDVVGLAGSFQRQGIR